ncbi:hypothetical protein Bca4012_016536 [Brassica carinata]
MKRKRGGVRGRGNENFPASSNSGRLISPAALQQQAFPVPVRSVSTVPLTSVFNRVYQTIGSTPSSTTYDALDAAHGRNLASPHTPSTAPVRLFAFNIGNEDTPTDIDGDIEEDDQILKDDFLGGVSDVEVELDLDCSSQESTDSENEADIVEVHAKPHTDPYRPPPFCMKSILERCQKRSEMSTKVQTKPKEEEYFSDRRTGPAARKRPASPPPKTRPSGPAKQTLIPPALLRVPPVVYCEDIRCKVRTDKICSSSSSSCACKIGNN